MGLLPSNPSHTPPPVQLTQDPKSTQSNSATDSNMVNGLAQKRIRNELKEIQDNSPPNWHVIANSSKWNQWTVELRADNDSPFHSKTIEASVVFPPEYPKAKPNIRVKRPELFFHPNISESGEICEQTMKSVNPATTIRERIQGFSFILTHPNERDAYNFSAVSLYRKSKREYFIKASMVFREREKKPHPETNFLEK